jgi:hypothetical protein
MKTKAERRASEQKGERERERERERATISYLFFSFLLISNY